MSGVLHAFRTSETMVIQNCFGGGCDTSDSDEIQEQRFKRIHQHAETIARSSAAIRADALKGHKKASSVDPED